MSDESWLTGSAQPPAAPAARSEADFSDNDSYLFGILNPLGDPIDLLGHTIDSALGTTRPAPNANLAVAGPLTEPQNTAQELDALWNTLMQGDFQSQPGADQLQQGTSGMDAEGQGLWDEIMQIANQPDAAVGTNVGQNPDMEDDYAPFLDIPSLNPTLPFPQSPSTSPPRRLLITGPDQFLLPELPNLSTSVPDHESVSDDMEDFDHFDDLFEGPESSPKGSPLPAATSPRRTAPDTLRHPLISSRAQSAATLLALIMANLTPSLTARRRKMQSLPENLRRLPVPASSYVPNQTRRSLRNATRIPHHPVHLGVFNLPCTRPDEGRVPPIHASRRKRRHYPNRHQKDKEVSNPVTRQTTAQAPSNSPLPSPPAPAASDSPSTSAVIAPNPSAPATTASVQTPRSSSNRHSSPRPNPPRSCSNRNSSPSTRCTSEGDIR
ncbi:hypothetical protein H4Q26_001018 [Puccinia striiformis f. sp. tritici PST-130]|nr:hypothetical protein H4Q26_001018 [Puccinia striiformis f. sp. tritici PST-130]